MIHVTKMVSKKKGIDVYFDETLETISPFLCLKYHVKQGATLSLEAYRDLLNEQMYENVYQLSLKKLARPISTLSFKQWLYEKEVPYPMIIKLVESFTKMKLLNDEYYTMRFIETHPEDGYDLLFQKLSDLGIRKELIYSELAKVSFSERLKHVLNKKIKSVMKLPHQKKKEKLMFYAYHKGYQSENVEGYIDDILRNVKDDVAVHTIEKDAAKALKKYQDIVDDNERYHKIMTFLMRKGYTSESIRLYLKK